MDHNSKEYLDLFKQINQETNPQNNNGMLKETPNYDNLQNLNEVQRHRQPSQNFNMNEFNVETRIDGKLNEANPNAFYGNDNINEVRRQQKQEKLNEVYRVREQERLNAIKQEEINKREAIRKEQERKAEEERKLTESVDFKNVDYVSVEMFNKARYSSMMQVANRTKIT